MSDYLTIAVISDLHCRAKSSDQGITTRLYSDIARKPANQHPISSLINLVKEEGLKADIILCPGDIADKADNQGMMSGWAFLLDVQKAFNAKHLFTTLGNHDVKSREFQSKESNTKVKDPQITTPFDFVKNVADNYPFDNESVNKLFWADHFVVIEDDNFNFLIFNSSYSHINSESASRCVITDAILYEMEVKLKNINNNKYSIAMCHHHPIKHANKDYYDDDVMDKGDALVNLVDKYNFDLLIHGHKHDPRITVINSLPILAAGSFSSLTNLADVGADNVFHLITLNKEKKATITSYIYKPQKGWHLNHGSYFPSKTGFGFKNDITELTNKAATWIKKRKKPFVLFSDLLKEFPDFEFLNPQQQHKVQNIMKEYHQLEFEPRLTDGCIKIVKMIH